MWEIPVILTVAWSAYLLFKKPFSPDRIRFQSKKIVKPTKAELETCRQMATLCH